MSKNNEFLAEHKLRNKISQLFSKYKHGNNIYAHGMHTDYIEYIIKLDYIQVYHKKNYEMLLANPPIHIYINKINNRLMRKIKDGYKLELQTSETMKIFGSTKKLIEKTKYGENVPSLEVVEVVLEHYSLV